MLDTVSFLGMGDTPITFLADGLTAGTDENKTVKLTAAKTVGLCADNDIDFIGRVTWISEDGTICSVEISGIVQFGYSGSLGASQVMQLVANASGGLKLDETNGKYYQVLDVDAVNEVLFIQLPSTGF